MEPRKSIRDITSSNSKIISDIVSEQPIVKKTKVTSKIVDLPVEEKIASEGAYIPVTPKKPNISIFVKIRNIVSHTRPVYIIGLLLIVILILVLVFIPSPTTKDPAEQAKVEAEVVKKQLSKHIILPSNEQIDIRKITSKLEDPFFQNAEIGDYLIIFYKNRIAYIYSVEKDIIVNAGVVFIDPKTATTTSTSSKVKAQ
ncbi:hypothetical protein H7Y21_03355 [Arenimonas sp.]|nr:hypothetical protein [Candidatus Parcubacteria bacterium]